QVPRFIVRVPPPRPSSISHRVQRNRSGHCCREIRIVALYAPESLVYLTQYDRCSYGDILRQPKRTAASSNFADGGPGLTEIDIHFHADHERARLGEID